MNQPVMPNLPMWVTGRSSMRVVAEIPLLGPSPEATRKLEAVVVRMTEFAQETMRELLRLACK